MGESIDEDLLGPAPTAADIPRIADALRRRRTMGEIGIASGLPNLAAVGKGLTDEADQYGQDLQHTRQVDNNLQEAKDRSAQQNTQFGQSLAEDIRNHNMIDSRQRDIALLEKKAHAGDLSAEEYDALQKAVAEHRLNPDKINSRTGKIYAAMEMLHPGTVDFNVMASEGAMMRSPLQMARANIVEQLPSLIKGVADLGSKLNFSNVRPVGVLQEWAKSQSNDPLYHQYMAQRNDVLMTIASAMRGVGMSDQAQKAEMDAAPSAASPRAFEGWARGQMNALGPRLRQAEKYTRDDSVDGSKPINEPVGQSSGMSGYAPDKEARYQAWKAAQGG